MDIFFIFLYIGNLLNYIDRGLVSTLLPTLSKEFNMTHVQEGMFSSSFMIGYAIFSLIFSYLCSKTNKLYLLLFGFTLWNISTIIMYTSKDMTYLYVGRSLSGIGEASFQSIVPIFLVDLYGKTEGLKKSSIFFTAIAVGYSIGMLIGGCIENWRYIYLVEGIFGFIIQCTLLKFYNQYHKISNISYNSSFNMPIIRSDFDIVCTIFKTREWWYTIIAYTFISYSSGVLSLWAPTIYKTNFLENINYEILVSILASITLSSGIIGSVLGNKYNNYMTTIGFKRYNVFRMGVIVSIICLISTVFSILVQLGFTLCLISLFISLVCFSFLTMLNSNIVISCVPQDCISYCTSLCLLFIHLGGDMPSPLISSALWSYFDDLVYASLLSHISLIFAIFIYSYSYFKVKKTTNTLALFKKTIIEV